MELKNVKAVQIKKLPKFGVLSNFLTLFWKNFTKNPLLRTYFQSLNLSFSNLQNSIEGDNLDKTVMGGTFKLNKSLFR